MVHFLNHLSSSRTIFITPKTDAELPAVRYGLEKINNLFFFPSPQDSCICEQEHLSLFCYYLHPSVPGSLSIFSSLLAFAPCFFFATQTIHPVHLKFSQRPDIRIQPESREQFTLEEIKSFINSRVLVFI